MSAPSPPGRFFTDVVQRDILIRGVPAKSPTFYRDVRMLMGVFSADLAALRAELANHVAPFQLAALAPLVPLAVLPGRGLVAIHAFDYRDTDVGPYGELAVSIAVHPPGSRLPGPLAAARAVLTGAFHAVVIAMPVTTDLALWGGLDYFNFPKTLADLAFTESATATTCTLRDRSTGALELELVGRRLAAKPLYHRTWGRFDRDAAPSVCTFTSYPRLEGRLTRARVRLHILAAGTRYRGDGLTLALGHTALGRRLERLGLGRLLMYWDVPRAEAILYAPEPLA